MQLQPIAGSAGDDDRLFDWGAWRDTILRQRWLPFGFAVGCAGLVTLGYLRATAWWRDPWAFPLDDAAIHLAIAQNLATSGTWGIEPGRFASCSSSPGWTLLLALTGWGAEIVTPRVPVAINLLLTVALLGLLWQPLRPVIPARMRRALTVVGIFLVLPGPLLILHGMEHLAHVVAALSLVPLLVRAVSPRTPVAPASTLRGRPAKAEVGAEGAGSQRWLLGLIAVTCAIRSETWFLLAPATALAVWRGRGRQTIAWWVVALLPTVLLGLVAHRHGWPWLPMSLWLKSTQTFDGVPYAWWHLALKLPAQLITNPLLGAMVLTLAALARGWWLVERAETTGSDGAAGARPVSSEPGTVTQRHGPGLTPGLAAGIGLRPIGPRASDHLGLVLATCLLHLQFASVGYLFRYEAWLLALGLAASLQHAATLDAIQVGRHPPDGRQRLLTWVMLAAATVWSGSMLHRAYQGWWVGPIATRAVATLQLPVARFLAAHDWPGRVVVHDIGATAALGRTRFIDAWGLADLPIGLSRLAGHRTLVAQEAHLRAGGAGIAVLFPELVERWGGVPDGWRAIADLETEVPAPFYSRRFRFYACSSVNEELLRRRLAAHGWPNGSSLHWLDRFD